MARQNGSRKVAKAKVYSIREEMLWLIYLSFFLLCASVLGPGKAQGADRIRELSVEREAWTADIAQFPRVEGLIAKLIQEDPSSAFAHYLMAKLYLRRFMADPSEPSFLRRASELGQQAIDLDQDSDGGYVIIADILDIMGQPQNALKILDPNLNPKIKSTWRTYFTAARLSSDLLPPEDILDLMDKAMAAQESQAPIIAPYVIGIIDQEYQGERLVAKITEWQERHPNNFFLYAKAMALVDAERYVPAHLIYESIYRNDTKFVAAMVNDGALLYMHLSRTEDGKRVLEQVLKADKDVVPAQVLATAHSHLGLIHLQKNEAEAARLSFTAAVVSSENPTEMVNAVSQQYKKFGTQKLLVRFIQGLNIELPGVAHFHVLLGEAFSEGMQDHKRALTAFADALVLEPQRSDIYNGMGLAYYRMNDFKHALFLFKSATKVDPQDSTAKYNEACVLARLGRSKEALLSLGEAITLDPRLSESARNDIDFANVKAMEQFVELTRTSPVPRVSVDEDVDDSTIMRGH